MSKRSKGGTQQGSFVMTNVIDQINAAADKIASEGDIFRASEVRAGAIEIRRLQIENDRLRSFLTEIEGMFRETQFGTTELDLPNYEVLEVARKALRQDP